MTTAGCVAKREQAQAREGGGVRLGNDFPRNFVPDCCAHLGESSYEQLDFVELGSEKGGGGPPEPLH